jgi:hypothetical protein
MTHTLIWKSPREQVIHGRPTPLLGWQRYELRGNSAQFFSKVGSPAPLAGLVASALNGAITAGRDVTIGQQPEDPEITSAEELLPILMELRPAKLVCRERPERAGASVRWVIAHLDGTKLSAPPSSMPETAIQDAVNAFTAVKYPSAAPRGAYHSVPALLLRHGVSAESLGVIEPKEITPDDVLASIAEDPAVREAAARWDLATPSTHRALAAARDRAQAQLGIPVKDRAYLYSAEVDRELLTTVFRLGPGGEHEAARRLRQDFDRRYGELGGEVLAFCLRTYQHGNIDGLRRAVEALPCQAGQP